MGDADDKALVSDLTGLGKLADSRVVGDAYEDGISPAMKQVGALAEDTLKTFRLFTAPLQLAASYQDRFARFCERVRDQVPEDHHRDASPEIARPVMEALQSTGDDSPLMEMFESLMARAIDDRDADSLSPAFASVIESLSPYEAKLVKDLTWEDHSGRILIDSGRNVIVRWLDADFDYEKYGGRQHYLTLSQALKAKELVAIHQPAIGHPGSKHGELTIPANHYLRNSIVTLSMYGRWFARCCVPGARLLM